MIRRGLFLVVAGALLAAGLAPTASRAVKAAQPVLSAASFADFLEAFRPEAERQGITRRTYDAAFAGVTPDASLAPLIRSQPEFAKPIGGYLAAQVTPARIAAGRARLAQWRATLDTIEARFQIPGSIVIAIWALETNYGASPGSKDVIRSLATLAAMNYRPDLYRAELVSALRMLQDGEVTRETLRGSWAGAMGQPQFMPSSYQRYAVDGDGDGRRDIWTSVPDTLASIASFLHAQGWRPGQPWGFEVRLPTGFDIAQSRALFPTWQTRGVVRADGSPMPDAGEGILFFPAGAPGPTFLVTPNFEVLKTYNFSDAYVLSLAQLADRMTGGPAVAATWPSAIPLARPDRIALQTRLVDLGYTVDNREGRISLALRDTIRLAQVRVGLPPDGNPTATLLTKLNQVH